VASFKIQSLKVAAVVPNGYISVYDLKHQRVGASTVGYSEMMRMPCFLMYEKSNLTINLERTPNDTFTDFELEYNYDGRDNWVNIGNNRSTGAVTYNLITAAGVKTKLH
jgi:hypothetical protein